MLREIKKVIPQKLINLGVHLPRAILANLRNSFPSRNMTVIGVTGTDGKTTTVNMIYKILKDSGKRVSMVSTINAEIGGKSIDTGFHVTSPEPGAIQRYIRQAKESGSEVLILEVTSHALDQFRVWGINFDIGVITNITHEHLDYHKSWENYFLAKAKLIKNVKLAVLNADEKHFNRLSKLTLGKVVTFGLDKNSDYNPHNIKLDIKLPGIYNKLNALAALAVCTNLGVVLKDAMGSLSKFESLTGRMEEIKNNKGIKIVIDFAHTPNALENALTALSRNKHGRLISVFGCAGLRDEKKRPLMGEISARKADITVITAEDPRGMIEEINEQIIGGAIKGGGKLGENIIIETDRAKAIELAIKKIAKRGDTVGIFGKGHETSMNINGLEEVPWSDRKAVMEVLSK